MQAQFFVVMLLVLAVDDITPPKALTLDDHAVQKLVEDIVKVRLKLARAGLMTLLPTALWYF
jgi:hypothetical protein